MRSDDNMYYNAPDNDRRYVEERNSFNRQSGEFEVHEGRRKAGRVIKKPWDVKESGYERQLSNVKKMGADLKRLQKDMRRSKL